ncbi:MAG TPA: hypothetical protein VH115_00695, partial [Solirubrobacteraceae bacterium]|nr:hypothetical protein [Solirubrobacteraceae bacterium]
AYNLVWHGDYYEVWARGRRARVALAVAELTGPPAQRCARAAAVARVAVRARARLVWTDEPQLVRVSFAGVVLPRGWGHAGQGVSMRGAGRVTLPFTLPSGGRWELWLQGQIMPLVDVAIDGRRLASVAAELGGNSVVPNTLRPLAVTLRAGHHVLAVTRGHFSLAPGNGGFANVYDAFLTPAGAAVQTPLESASPDRWRSLCAHAREWAEAVP